MADKTKSVVATLQVEIAGDLFDVTGYDSVASLKSALAAAAKSGKVLELNTAAGSLYLFNGAMRDVVVSDPPALVTHDGRPGIHDQTDEP